MTPQEPTPSIEQLATGMAKTIERHVLGTKEPASPPDAVRRALVNALPNSLMLPNELEQRQLAISAEKTGVARVVGVEVEQPEVPQVQVQVSEVICQWHGEIFKHEWPSGYPTFAVVGLTEVLKLQAVIDECQGQAALIQRALAKRPLCCRLPKEQMVQILRDIPEPEESKHAFKRIGKCEGCGFELECCRFTKLNHYGRKISTHAHYCFSCCCAWAEQQRAIYDRKKGS